MPGKECKPFKAEFWRGSSMGYRTKVVKRFETKLKAESYKKHIESNDSKKVVIITQEPCK